MSNFHSITPYGSKVCHGSVTGVTCDTTVAGCDSAPPSGPSPRRPRRKKGKHVYTCKKKWKGKLGKSSESSKRSYKYVTNQSGYGRERKEKKKKILGCNSKGMGNRDANITPTQHSTTPLAPHPKLPKLDPTHSGGACPPWDLLRVMIPYHWSACWMPLSAHLG